MRKVTMTEFAPDVAVLDRLGPLLRRALRLRSGDRMPEGAAELHLAVHEVLVNVIEHGAPNADIEVRVIRQGLTLAVEIRDTGARYDRRHVRENAPGSLVERGWGIPLARALTDRFTYERDGEINRWTLTKGDVR